MTKTVSTPDSATESTDADRQIADPEGTISSEAPLAKPQTQVRSALTPPDRRNTRSQLFWVAVFRAQTYG